MLSDFTAWLVLLITQLWTDLWDFVKDAAIHIFDLFTQAVIAAVGAISVPTFMTTGFAGLFGGLDPGIRWLLSQTGFVAGLALLGAGLAFRLIRKVVTLFQW